MDVLVNGHEAMFNVSCIFYLPKTDMIPKVDDTLRKRYAKCRAASNVFSNPLSKIVLYG
jgi:hypothetical protein